MVSRTTEQVFIVARLIANVVTSKLDVREVAGEQED